MTAQELQRPIGFSPNEISSLINEGVLEQHAEEAAFLWSLRNDASMAPNYSLKELVDLDERLEANIEGLQIGANAGWLCLHKLLEQEELGALFVMAVIALEGNDLSKVQLIYRKVEANHELSDELLAAFAWVDSCYLKNVIHDLLKSPSTFWQCLGLSVCVSHGANPKDYITYALKNDNVELKARALRAVGELGFKQYSAMLKDALKSNNEDCIFWAAWSLLLIKELGSAQPVLKKIAESSSTFSNEAFIIYIRSLNTKNAYEWLKGFARMPGRARYAVKATAAVGDPIFIPWLIKQMAMPELAQVAGESFSSITGVDIEYEDLDGEPPEGLDSGPNDTPEDEDVSMDEDEDLAYPNSVLIQQWWDENKHKYTAGKRYLMGKEITEKTLAHVLLKGSQRQRAVAAIEISLRTAEVAIFQTKNPAKRQQKELG